MNKKGIRHKQMELIHGRSIKEKKNEERNVANIEDDKQDLQKNEEINVNNNEEEKIEEIKEISKDQIKQSSLKRLTWVELENIVS